MRSPSVTWPWHRGSSLRGLPSFWLFVVLFCFLWSLDMFRCFFFNLFHRYLYVFVSFCIFRFLRGTGMMKYLQCAAVPADSSPLTCCEHWGISLGKSNQEVEGFRTRDKHFVLWLSFLLSNADVLNLAVMLYDVIYYYVYIYYWIIDHQCWRNIIWLTWTIIVKRLPIPFPDFSLLPQVMTGNPVPPNSQLLAAPMEVGTMLSLDHLHLFSHLKGWCTLNVYNVYKYQHSGHFVEWAFFEWGMRIHHDMSHMSMIWAY